jgi:hypothetical protein
MKNLFLLASGLMLIFLSGCENNDLLLSEKKLNSKIQKTWKIVSPSPIIDAHENWNFSNGSLAINFQKNGVDTTVVGSYSIDAKMTKAYVTLSSFYYNNQVASHWTAKELNRKWTIVELDNGIMYLSGVDDNGVIRSMEFVEK